MSASLSAIPKWQVFDDNGIPLAGALLYTYYAGTSLQKATYTSDTGTISAANPIVFDAAGRSEVWLGTGSYKMILTDSLGATIWTVDGVSSSGGSGGSGQIVNTIADLKALVAGSSTLVTVLGYYAANDQGGGSFYWSASASGDDAGSVITPDSAPSTGRWMRIISENVNPRWFGAYGDGTHNDTPFFMTANTYASTNNKSLICYTGTYSWDTDPLLTVPVQLKVKAKLKWSTINPTIQPIIDDNDYSIHFDVPEYYNPLFNTGAKSIPQWFGAVGGDSAATATIDDTVAFKLAIESIKNNGGILFIPKSHYVISSDLTLYSNIETFGEGSSSVLHMGSNDGSIDWAGTIALFSHDTTATVVTNVNIHKFAIDCHKANQTGGGDVPSKAIVANLAYSTISDMFIENSMHDCLMLGGTYGSSYNVTVKNNIFMYNGIANYGTISLTSGENIDIIDNYIINTDMTADYGIKIQGTTNLNIKNNTLANATIKQVVHTTETAYLAISDNDIANLSGTAIAISGTPTGTVEITDNSIRLSSVDIGILIFGPAATVASYNIANNFLVDCYINLDNVNSQTFVTGNSVDCAIHKSFEELNTCTMIKYGLNISTFTTASPYTTVAARIVDLTDTIHSTISGDTTFDENVTVTKNLTVSGSLINPAFSSLFKSMISGLTLSNDTGDLFHDIKVTTGTASTTDGANDYLNTLTSDIVKQIDGTWVAGTGNGGLASGVSLTNATWYHVFIIGSATTPATCDVGFDTSVTAVNLLAGAGAPYTTYRRIGSVYYATATIQAFVQKGDYFNFNTTVGDSWSGYTNGVTTNRTIYTPLDVVVQARLSMYGYTANNALALNGWSVSDYGLNSFKDGMVGNHTTAWFDPMPKEVRIWTNTSSQIHFNTAALSTTSMTIQFYTIGWMDPRGKYTT